MNEKEIFKSLMQRVTEKHGSEAEFIGNMRYDLGEKVYFLCYYNIGGATFAEDYVVSVAAE